MSSPRRLTCINVDLALDLDPRANEDLEDEEEVTHIITVSLAYDSSGKLTEIVFVSRGKVGHGIDLLLQDLGIKLSRAIQGRNPNIARIPEAPL